MNDLKNIDDKKIRDDQLTEAMKGIHYKYYQFKDVSNILVHIWNKKYLPLLKFIRRDNVLLDQTSYNPCSIIQIYNNSIVESFTINFRCLLEFFYPQKEKINLNSKKDKYTFAKIIRAVNYYDLTQEVDLENYNQLKKIWEKNVSGPDPEKPSIQFKIYEKKKNDELSCVDYNSNEIYELLSAHVAHQIVWKIAAEENQEGRKSWKIEYWDPPQFYPGLRELVWSWLSFIREEKPHFFHSKWDNVTYNNL